MEAVKKCSNYKYTNFKEKISKKCDFMREFIKYERISKMLKLKNIRIIR